MAPCEFSDQKLRLYQEIYSLVDLVNKSSFLFVQIRWKSDFTEQKLRLQQEILEKYICTTNPAFYLFKTDDFLAGLWIRICMDPH